MISDEADRMSVTVNSILEAARLNSGRARWNWKEFELADIVHAAMAPIEALVDPARVALQASLQSSAKTMLGDPDAIRRLLVNLLSNAVKHTERGRIEIRARTFFEAGNAWVELAVEDTGPGIPPELTARLGEAFALNWGVVGDRHVDGTGLGLAICKGIAEAHGGHLRIDSVRGKGTRVTAWLRANLSEAATGETVRANSNDEVWA